VHLWLGVYARSAETLNAWDKDFAGWVSQRAAAKGSNGSNGKTNIEILGTQDVRRFWSDEKIDMHIDDDSSKPKHPVVLEHFGFRDGVSQPPIQGFEEHEAKDYRHGGGRLRPDGSWEALAPGEFLFGYVDVMGELPASPVPPAFVKNGSFMVQRKLEQDVDNFRSYLTRKANEVSSRNGTIVKADYLAAKILGRQRDGTPLANTNTLNNFRYSDDLDGSRCPLGAHMRRANPRDALGLNVDVCKTNGSTLVDRHRILRRAITYGDPVPTGAKQRDVNPDGQGLMFMTLQTNITRQFEFVQQQWINFGNDLNQGNDRDPVVGNQTGHGKIAIPGDTENPTVICNELPQFVRTRGGDYFFLPGISAFQRLAAGSFTSINTQS
jgi:Dyp-type peroxidase family